MSANSRFAVATHVLTSLALATEEDRSALVTSDSLSKSVNTSPVVVRRILGMLGKAGLVLAHTGRGGGARLAKPASRISMLDIHRAVDEPMLFLMNPNRPNPACDVSCRMKDVLGPVFDEAEKAVEERLRKVSLATLVSAIKAP